MDVKTWSTLSRLLDDALDLPLSERSRWLEGLGSEHDAVKPRLRELLAQAAAMDRDLFLATLPKFTAGGDDSRLAGAIPTSADAEPSRAGARVGPYTLLRPIASGGQGEVWVAERSDGLLGRPVALKLPHGIAWRPGLADRIARERDILAALTHPHIARLYDAGTTAEGEPYLALEYVEGSTIDAHARDHALSVPARVRLFLQVVGAVAFAHGQLVIHRDLKPSNILVTPDGSVRLLDFGIAKLVGAEAMDSTLTVAAGRAMTVAYASPEQVALQPLGVATDVYSLGVVLFELLTDARPYRLERESAALLEEAVLTQEARRASDAAPTPALRKALSGDLDTILAKALKKDVAERYASAEAFADDLQRYLDGRPVLARPDSRAYRTRKFVTRHRVGVAATAASLVATLGGAGLAVWQAQVARGEQRRAEAVKDFIASIFTESDPEIRGGARAVTALEVLDRARQRLETRVVDQPEAHAELLRLLGDSILGVGDPHKATEVLRAAVEETRALYGDDAEVTTAARLQLARASGYDAGTPTSDEQLAAISAALERTGRQESAAFVDAELIRASNIMQRGRARTPEAERAARSALDAATRVLPPGHRLRSRAAATLATALRAQGRGAEALPYAETAYREYLKAFGDDERHPSVIQSQNEYGRALYDADRPSEALTHLKQAAALGEEVFRENGLFVQHLLGTLANIQLTLGEVREGTANVRKALAVNVADVTLSDVYRGSQYAALGRAYLAGRRPGDALEPFAHAIALLRKGGDTTNVRVFETDQATALVQLGRDAEARASLDALLRTRPDAWRPSDRQAMLQRAILHQRAAEPAKAKGLLEEAADFTPTVPQARVVKAEILTQLGVLRVGSGDPQGALSMFDAAAQLLASVQTFPTPAAADVKVAQGRALLAAGRPSDAVSYLEAANQIWQEFDSAHADARDAARWLERARLAVATR